MGKFFTFLLVGLVTLPSFSQTTESKINVDDVVDVESEATEASPSPNTSEATIADPQAKPSENVEKIQVTGSHIKRIDVEGPSPVLTLDRDYLERSGHNSVADVLRDSAIASFGADREASGSSQAGAATMGLRGFGADKVLILLNGRRLPKIGGQNTVDLNLIPFQALDKVEILRDGASATYGSDALAGVINFVTKKDYDGVIFQSRLSVPDEPGGDRQDLSMTYGKNFSKGNVLAVYQYRNNSRIWDRDRYFTQGQGRSTLGTPGSFRVVDSEGKSVAVPNLRDDGKTVKGWQAAADCPEDRLVAAGPDGQTQCRFDFTPYSSGLPDIEQHNALVGTSYDLNSQTSAFATALFTRRQANWQYAPAPELFADNSTTGGKNYKLPANFAKGIGLDVDFSGVPQGSGLELGYRFVDELGPRANRDTTNSYGAVVGLRRQLGDTWDVEASANYGASNVFNLGHAGYGNADILFEQMKQGNLPILAPRSTKSANSVIQHTSEQWVDSSLSTVQVIANGELGEAFGGAASMAVGTAGSWEAYQVKVDEVTEQGALFGGAGESGQGARNYQSLFSELGLTWSSLEVQLAGRFDNFSDFGSTVNPKLGLRYRPLSFLMLRGSAGTGFRAPSLDELYSTQSYGYPSYQDPVGCARNPTDFNCQENQRKTLSGGNPNLQEETSMSWNLGTVLQPTRDFNFSVDYWQTTLNNGITGNNFSNIMLAEQQLGAAALAAHGVKVKRDEQGNLEELYAPALNLSTIRSEGIDASLGGNFRAGPLDIRPMIIHSYLLNQEQQIFPGMGYVSNLDEAGFPRWRNTVSVALGWFNHGLRLTGRTIAGQFYSDHLFDKADKRRIPTYTEYDLAYDFLGGWGGQIQLGARNLLGSKRPVDESAGFQDRLNTSLYDPIGRLYYVGYSQTF